MKKAFLFLPLLLLVAIVAMLTVPLMNKDNLSPTEDWRDKPIPEFVGKNLLDPNARLNNNSLPKEPYILNVWASWCTWCIKEFPILHKLKAEGVPIVGLTYSDQPNDAREALTQWGNPFHLVIDDYEKATEQAALLVQRYEVGAKVIHRDMDIYVCPNCGRRAKLNHAYCHWCGKKLLWNSIPASQQKVKKKK